MGELEEQGRKRAEEVARHVTEIGTLQKLQRETQLELEMLREQQSQGQLGLEHLRAGSTQAGQGGDPSREVHDSTAESIETKIVLKRLLRSGDLFRILEAAKNLSNLEKGS